jgi:hypothetical protein
MMRGTRVLEIGREIPGREPEQAGFRDERGAGI